MNMFGQMGEMKKLYDKYKTLQDKLKNLLIRAKEGKFVDSDGTEREDAGLAVSFTHLDVYKRQR